jgi:hypothetical protein
LEEREIHSEDWEIDGKSLLSVVRGEERDTRTFFADIASNVLDSHIPQKIAMNRGEEKLILNKKFRKEDLEFFFSHPPDLIPVEVYDLVQDPRERKNIAGLRSELANQIIRDIDRIFKEAEKRSTGKLKMSEELKKQLKALGYIR